MSFEDYDKFFYITTICFYEDGFVEDYESDDVSKENFGLMKLDNPSDCKKPVVFSLDQINARFDKNKDGSYEYAGAKLMVTKIEKTTDAQGKETKT